MSITAEQITIAVTIFNRRQYLKESLGSALAQTIPVRVMVVEDCGPDLELQAYVRQEFGPRVEYYRSPVRRGIFGNWNTCVERCQTRWLSILHDDDYLTPEFVAAMIELSKLAGERGIYWGQEIVIDDRGQPRPPRFKPMLKESWRSVGLEDVLFSSPFAFPGQLFDVALARTVGGFRETSLFSGDLELWAKLIARCGGAETRRTVGVFRDHSGWDRGSNMIYRSGKTFALMNVQRKRNLALYRSCGGAARFNRDEDLCRSCLPTRYLFHYAAGFSRYYLNYYAGLLRRSSAPHWRYAVFQRIVGLLGPRAMVWASILFRRWNGLAPLSPPDRRRGVASSTVTEPST